MSGYALGITCPRCGGDVVHVTNGLTAYHPDRAEPYIKVSQAVVRCDPCRKEWLVRAVIEPGPVLNASERARGYRAKANA
jgi:hypothetical protein